MCSEFRKFIEDLGVVMTTEEMKLLFQTIDTNSNGKITLDEFSEYFVDFITDDRGVKTGK